MKPKFKIFYPNNKDFVLSVFDEYTYLEYLIKIKPNNRFKIKKRTILKTKNHNDDIKNKIIIDSLPTSTLSHYYNLKELIEVILYEFKTIYLKINK